MQDGNEMSEVLNYLERIAEIQKNMGDTINELQARIDWIADELCESDD